MMRRGTRSREVYFWVGSRDGSVVVLMHRQKQVVSKRSAQIEQAQLAQWRSAVRPLEATEDIMCRGSSAMVGMFG
jgi:hypothetical protein